MVFYNNGRLGNYEYPILRNLLLNLSSLDITGNMVTWWYSVDNNEFKIPLKNKNTTNNI